MCLFRSLEVIFSIVRLFLKNNLKRFFGGLSEHRSFANLLERPTQEKHSPSSTSTPSWYSTCFPQKIQKITRKLPFFLRSYTVIISGRPVASFRRSGRLGFSTRAAPVSWPCCADLILCGRRAYVRSGPSKPNQRKVSS